MAKKETIDLRKNVHEKYEAMNLGTLFLYAIEYNKDEYNLYFNYFISTDKMLKGLLTIAEYISPKLERHLKWSNDKGLCFTRKQIYGWIPKNHPTS
jgi:hypothetical protein